jgi:putative hemolysin
LDATGSLDDVNQTLMVNLERDEDSIGGFIYDKLGKIPLPGDRLQINGVEVEVLSTERRRIKKVKVTVRGQMAEAAGAE